MTASPAARASAGPDQLSDLRILLVHQWLYTWAGAERCLEELLRVVPHADVIVGMATPEMRARHDVARRAAETWVGKLPGARRHHRWFLPLHALAFSRIDTSGYDVVISLSHGFEKTVRVRNGAVHLCYCLSPPRWLWDLRETYAARGSRPQRWALKAATAPLRALDLRSARSVDRFVSISQTVAQRVQRWYGRESDVVYPPVAAKVTAPDLPRKPFLLSLGRLVPYKRVDLAIAGAERAGIRLVVAGDGPDRPRLERVAGRHTEFVGEVSEQEAGRLLSTCSAFLFCGEEDFGIAPLEANAHGAPVIGYARGALTETIEDGATGTLFNRQTVADVASGIERCLARTWNPIELRANAARFSPETFRERMRAILTETMS